MPGNKDMVESLPSLRYAGRYYLILIYNKVLYVSVQRVLKLNRAKRRQAISLLSSSNLFLTSTLTLFSHFNPHPLTYSISHDSFVSTNLSWINLSYGCLGTHVRLSRSTSRHASTSSAAISIQTALFTNVLNNTRTSKLQLLSMRRERLMESTVYLFEGESLFSGKILVKTLLGLGLKE